MSDRKLVNLDYLDREAQLFKQARINIEEKTLLNDLEGYDNYCKKVKARLIPFLF